MRHRSILEHLVQQQSNCLQVALQVALPRMGTFALSRAFINQVNASGRVWSWYLATPAAQKRASADCSQILVASESSAPILLHHVVTLPAKFMIIILLLQGPPTPGHFCVRAFIYLQTASASYHAHLKLCLQRLFRASDRADLLSQHQHVLSHDCGLPWMHYKIEIEIKIQSTIAAALVRFPSGISSNTMLPAVETVLSMALSQLPTT